jgi:hypothetical protein
MPEPKAAPEEPEAELEASAAMGLDGPPPAIDELVSAEDAAGLLALGAAHRVGTPFVKRDLFKALECFEAASRLGDAEAEFLVGAAYCDGIGIAADLAEGAKRLRSAAQRGSLRAKVYVANLYEMGVYYQVDREKADVWYRNVARAANLESDPASPEYAVAMAELGCVRHCLELVADAALPAKDRTLYLKKAKAMGYGHRLAQAKRETTPVPAPEPKIEAPPEPPKIEPAPPKAEAKVEAKKEEKKKDEKTREEPSEVMLGEAWTWVHGVLAFVAALFFASASSVAGWLAMEGSRAVREAGRPLPGVGTHHEIVFWAVVLALGVLPATSAYRGRVVAIATVTGALLAAGGHYAWNALRLVPNPLAQSALAGLGSFLIVLLILGLLGGTRARVLKRNKRLPRASTAPV